MVGGMYESLKAKLTYYLSLRPPSLTSHTHASNNPLELSYLQKQAERAEVSRLVAAHKERLAKMYAEKPK